MIGYGSKAAADAFSPGEKLAERLFADDEHVEITHHSKLQRARRGGAAGALAPAHFSPYFFTIRGA